MDRLEALRLKNSGLTIHTVDEKLFSVFARIVKSPVFEKIADYVDKNTVITPKNTYEADLTGAHSREIDEALAVYYGGVVPQIGYCNGANISMNGSEYHKGPELTIAITDCLMWWMRPEHLVNFDYADSSNAEIFYIPKGCAFLLKPEVLHLAPCRVDGVGYKTVIILPMGTNRPLEAEYKARLKASGDPEAKILHATDKWMITHCDWAPLRDQGVHIGLKGENRRVYQID